MSKEPSEFINWGEISRAMAGTRMTIRKNRVPKKHEAKIKRLLKLIEKWQEWAGI